MLYFIYWYSVILCTFIGSALGWLQEGGEREILMIILQMAPCMYLLNDSCLELLIRNCLILCVTFRISSTEFRVQLPSSSRLVQMNKWPIRKSFQIQCQPQMS